MQATVPVDTIYIGGDIYTIAGIDPKYVETLAVP